MQTVSFTPIALGLDERRYQQVISQHQQQVRIAEELRSSYLLLFAKSVDLTQLRQWSKLSNPREAISQYYCEVNELTLAAKIPVRYAEWIKILNVDIRRLDALCEALAQYKPDVMETYFDTAQGCFTLSDSLKEEVKKECTLYTKDEWENQLARIFEGIAGHLNELEEMGIKFTVPNPDHQLPQLLQRVLTRVSTRPHTGNVMEDSQIPDHYSLNVFFNRYLPIARKTQPVYEE
jgi:hypothetical protein